MQAVKRTEKAGSRITLARILLMLACISVLLAGGLCAYLLLIADIAPPTETPKMLPKQEPRLASSDVVSAAVKTIAQQYLNAGLQGRYDRLWSILHPEKRTLWSGETAFAAFWKERFQDYHLQRFTLGKVWMLPEWVNPETMTSFSNVLLVYVSLQLVPKAARQLTQQQAPPEDLNPTPLFQNLPFVAQHIPGDRWRVLDGGPFDLEAPILPPIETTVRTVQVPILMYHHISDTPVHDALSASLEVTPALFARQMDYLKARGYRTITFNQLFNTLYYNAPLPPRPIILTFDDGYDDAYKFAYPILKAHDFSGMFYIITGKVGWQGQMTWPQMREMLQNGMQMGSHTIHHVDMGQVLLESLEQAQQELQISQLTLQKYLGIPIQQFCYPSGEPFNHGTLALRQEIVLLLAQDGYIGATTDPGMTGTTQSSLDPFVLLRIRIDGRNTLGDFEQSLL
jgi:peptidoglycan/xylan/chitin deacetylase (PgdA/CDA1 family)